MSTGVSERRGFRPTPRERGGLHGAGVQEDADVKVPRSRAHAQRVRQRRAARGSPLVRGKKGDSRYVHDCASTVGPRDRMTPSRGERAQGALEDARGETGVTQWW